MPGSKTAPSGAGKHSRGLIPAALDRRSNSEQDREVGLLLSVAPSHLLSVYGYWAIAGIVGLEGIGIPFPGEATLILAAVYAGSTHHLDIRLVFAAAAAGPNDGRHLGFRFGLGHGYQLCSHTVP